MKETIPCNNNPARPVIWSTFVLASICFAASAASLTDTDRQEGLAQLERTRTGVIEATQGLTEAQWKFKPGPTRWSIAETMEHIALAEDMLFQHASQNVMKAPEGKPDRDAGKIDKLVLNAISNRTQKAQAPEPLQPTGRWSPAEALAHFQKSRARTVEYLKSAQGLRNHVFESPLGEPLDAYEWLLYTSAHSDRHTKQILEVKADPNFPK